MSPVWKGTSHRRCGTDSDVAILSPCDGGTYLSRRATYYHARGLRRMRLGLRGAGRIHVYAVARGRERERKGVGLLGCHDGGMELEKEGTMNRAPTKPKN